MNIFEQFLNKISHKFPKGYPDMNNEQDISLLESLVSDVLDEAFTVFPKSEDEIENSIRLSSFKPIDQWGKDYLKKNEKKLFTFFLNDL